MDIVNFNALQRASRQGFNQYLPERPVFAYYGASTTQAYIDMFAANQRRPMRSWYKGSYQHPEQPLSVTMTGNSEIATNNYWGSTASSWSATSSFGPTGGYTGLGAHGNTMLLNGFELSPEGYYPVPWETSVYETHSSMGAILGENADYQQGINLLKLAQYIFVGYTDDVRLSMRVNEPRNCLNWTTLAGLTRLAGTANTSFGDICYNRKTNTLAFIETNSTSSVSRLHIFKALPEKIKANAVRLKAMLEDAIAGRNGSSYEVFDFTWVGSTTNEWYYSTRLIACDDGTFWLARQNVSNNGQGYGLCLARIYFLSGTTRAFATVDRQVCNSTIYDRNNGMMYGSRHMLSDDNKFVAVYANYYYYWNGGNFFFLPRDSAATATRYKKATLQDTSYGMSIAPAGGSDFIIGWANDANSKYSDGAFVSLANDNLNATAVLLSGFFNYCTINGFNTSTNLGGNGFVKVQNELRQTTEWNERIAA